MRASTRSRLVRIAALAGLVGALTMPAVGPASAAEESVTLRTGTDQVLQVLNPWNSIEVVDFEIYTLNYDLLVNFGRDLESVPGFAESWTPSNEGKTWTFKIRPGMKWSDGTPATSEDARYTYQLVLDAAAKELTLGAGYLEGYLTNAGITAVSAPDPETLVVETEFANTLLLQAYVPILPKHIWSQHTLEEIANAEGADPFTNEPPVVGTGPYQTVEWEADNFIRFARNPHYWGTNGAAEEVIVQHFSSADTMVQALKNGEIDYVRGVLPDQFEDLKDEPDIVAVEGLANGYSELSINTKGNTEGYGGSTAALTDIKFRDALGYAIDQSLLVDRTLGGYGEPGTTIVPPYHTRWHVEPDRPRRFDIEEAKRRLDAAGYALDGSGKRLDKEGKPINLRLTWPNSEAEHATDAQFIEEWFGQLGITVEASNSEDSALIQALTPPPDGPGDYDIYMWGWVGDPDPTSLLSWMRTEAIGSGSDSYYSNPRYDELFEQQRAETDPAKRKALIAEMQNLVYDEAPYHVLYYDSELHAYRTDKFSGWSNQPTQGGTPLFGYGSIGYTLLEPLEAASSPSPAAPSAGASAGASAAPTTPTGTTGDSGPLLIAGIAVLVAIIGIGLVLSRRRSTAGEEE